jgi:hypothetical protein
MGVGPSTETQSDPSVGTESKPLWNFYLADAGRSVGWTNHGFVFQFVCRGQGENPEEAWLDAKANNNVPEGFLLPEALTAIPQNAEVEFNAT